MRQSGVVATIPVETHAIPIQLTGVGWVPMQHTSHAWVLDGFKPNHGLHFPPILSMLMQARHRYVD